MVDDATPGHCRGYRRPRHWGDADVGGLLDARRQLGVAIAKGVAHSPWPTVVTTWFVALSLGVSVIVGVASGLYPAMRAARLDPIHALHAE